MRPQKFMIPQNYDQTPHNRYPGTRVAVRHPINEAMEAVRDAEHRATLVSPHYADIERQSDPIPLARPHEWARDTLPDYSFRPDGQHEALDDASTDFMMLDSEPDSDCDDRPTLPVPVAEPVTAHAIIDVGARPQRATIIPDPPNRYPSALRTCLPHRAVLVPEGWFEEADLSWSLYGE